MKLGVYPTKRYNRSWITQRFVNRAPKYTWLRRSPASTGQQLLNPVAQNIQKTVQGLTSERYNMFLPTANIDIISSVYIADLPKGMSFSYDENANSTRSYIQPTVYAMIDSVEYEISIAEQNNRETFWDFALPSRIEYNGVSVSYETILDGAAVKDLPLTALNPVSVDGHIYLTIRDNTIWEYRIGNSVYYPKAYITGLTRKETTITETIPLRYNGTFKSVNEWQEIQNIFISYVSEDAEVTLECFPFNNDSLLDTRNINIPISNPERIQFFGLETHTWGSTYAVKAFTSHDMNIVRDHLPDKEISYELELLDSSSENIAANGFVAIKDTDYIYAVDDAKLYVYNIALPYPDTSGMETQSSDAKMDIYSDRWLFSRDEEAVIKTRNNDVANVPLRTRWSLEKPDGNIVYFNSEGQTTTNKWYENVLWEQTLWENQHISIILDQAGTYKVLLECQYIDRDDNSLYTLETKELWCVPSITPEVEYELPVELKFNDGIVKDSDGKYWVLVTNTLYSLDLFFDYYLVDYKSNRIWLREDYSSVRVVP